LQISLVYYSSHIGKVLRT